MLERVLRGVLTDLGDWCGPCLLGNSSPFTFPPCLQYLPGTRYMSGGGQETSRETAATPNTRQTSLALSLEEGAAGRLEVSVWLCKRIFFGQTNRK